LASRRVLLTCLRRLLLPRRGLFWVLLRISNHCVHDGSPFFINSNSNLRLVSHAEPFYYIAAFCTQIHTRHLLHRTAPTLVMSGEDHDYVQGWRDLDSLRLPYAKPHLWKAAVEQDPPTARMAKLKNNPLPSETAYLQSKQKSGSIYAHSISPSSSTSTNRMSGISRSSKKKPRGERSKKRRQHGGMGSSKSTSYLLRHMESSKFVHDTTYEATMADLAAEQLKAQSRHERKKTHDDRRQEDKAQGKRERLKAHSNTVSHFKRIVGSPTRFPRNKLPSGNAESNAFSHTVSFAFPTPSRAAGAAEAAAAALSDFQASLSAAKQQDASKLTAASCVRLPTHHTQPPPQLQQQRTPSISSPTLPTVRTAVDLAAGTPVAPAIALLQQGIGHLTTSLTRVLKLEPHRANFAADKTDKLLITPADRRDAHDAEVGQHALSIDMSIHCCVGVCVIVCMSLRICRW
jgi:hypothetical protein